MSKENIVPFVDEWPDREPDSTDPYIMAFLRDDPFTMDHRLFVNRKTGEEVWCGDGLEDVEEYENRAAWIEVPGTHHSVWHEEFRKFLGEHDLLSEYSGSIGGAIRYLPKEVCHLWDERKLLVAAREAHEWQKRQRA